MFRTNALLTLALLLLGVAATGASADERILHYHSDIIVNADGSTEVTEAVRVRAEGKSIRRGIFRDFPTDYKDRLGNRVQIEFVLLGVTRDGSPEPYHSERRGNGVRVYAGSADVLLDPGTYEYAIRYRTTRMLGFFADHDELYWNVTGNGWDFAIDEASATITLPEAVARNAIRVEGYTGPFGSNGQDYTAEVNFNGQAQIRTTRTLAPHEGLTVVVAWPQGSVTRPTASENARHLLRQNLGLLVALSCGLGSLLYLFMAWRRVGMDPPPGVIFPHYEPPPGFSPASIRYILKMGYDKRALTAAVLNLAVKGFITIENDDDEYTLLLGEKSLDDSLAPGERALLSKLFRQSTRIAMDNENHAVIADARRDHESALKRDYYQRYFVTNGVLVLPSIVLLLGALMVALLLGQISLAIITVLVVSAIALGVFVWLLRAPTLLGRRLMDKVEGFRMYLEVAEKDDLNLRNPPEKTPELFEAYLPYALALGVEQPWAEQFEEVFRRISGEQGRDYHPAWYAGRWDAANPVSMANAVGGSLGSAISSAATPPGSSSGSGGGGFSGGGGGGGGGGGW